MVDGAVPTPDVANGDEVARETKLSRGSLRDSACTTQLSAVWH